MFYISTSSPLYLWLVVLLLVWKTLPLLIKVLELGLIVSSRSNTPSRNGLVKCIRPLHIVYQLLSHPVGTCYTSRLHYLWVWVQITYLVCVQTSQSLHLLCAIVRQAPKLFQWAVRWYSSHTIHITFSSVTSQVVQVLLKEISAKLRLLLVHLHLHRLSHVLLELLQVFGR